LAQYGICGVVLRHCSGGGFSYFFTAEFEMNARESGSLILSIVLLAGFAGIWRLQQAIDVQRDALHEEKDDLVLRSGPMLKAMSLEYAPLLADLYWTRVVQYYGDKHARHDENLELLWPLLDVTTTLDPNLLVAYRFGSMFLSEPRPGGAGRPDLAIDLINRGIRANPDYWRLYEDLGFIYYFELNDFQKASAAFLEGSKNPAAFLWMKVLAAKVMEEGESSETSAFLWSEIYNSTKDPQIKKNAASHLQLLQVDADCKNLDAIVADFEKRTGQPPKAMHDLVSARLLARSPVDPLGFPYVLGADRKVQLNPASPLAEQKRRYQKPLAAPPR
jgi:tetratricopeptide (TPR) repeat protein